MAGYKFTDQQVELKRLEADYRLTRLQVYWTNKLTTKLTDYTGNLNQPQTTNDCYNLTYIDIDIDKWWMTTSCIDWLSHKLTTIQIGWLDLT